MNLGQLTENEALRWENKILKQKLKCAFTTKNDEHKHEQNYNMMSDLGKQKQNQKRGQSLGQVYKNPNNLNNYDTAKTQID